MAKTALTLIRRSLRTIGALGIGQILEPAQADDAFEILNVMLDAWRTNRLLFYVTKEFDFALVSNQQVYTIGVGGNFNTTRPVFIAGISLIDPNNPNQPLELQLYTLTRQQWQGVPVKAVQSRLPTEVYWLPDYPLGQLKYWPIPNVNNLSTRLYLPVALGQFATLDTVYDFPPGYEEAAVYNLAIRLAPEWSRAAEQNVVELASMSLGNIQRINEPDDEMSSDPALRGSQQGFYDWRADVFRG